MAESQSKHANELEHTGCYYWKLYYAHSVLASGTFWLLYKALTHARSKFLAKLRNNIKKGNPSEQDCVRLFQRIENAYGSSDVFLILTKKYLPDYFHLRHPGEWLFKLLNACKNTNEFQKFMKEVSEATQFLSRDDTVLSKQTICAKTKDIQLVYQLMFDLDNHEDAVKTHAMHALCGENSFLSVEMSQKMTNYIMELLPDNCTTNEKAYKFIEAVRDKRIGPDKTKKNGKRKSPPSKTMIAERLGLLQQEIKAKGLAGQFTARLLGDDYEEEAELESELEPRPPRSVTEEIFGESDSDEEVLEGDGPPPGSSASEPFAPPRTATEDMFDEWDSSDGDEEWEPKDKRVRS